MDFAKTITLHYKFPFWTTFHLFIPLPPSPLYLTHLLLALKTQIILEHEIDLQIPIILLNLKKPEHDYTSNDVIDIIRAFSKDKYFYFSKPMLSRIILQTFITETM